MAREFAVRDAAEAVEFVAAEMHSEGAAAVHTVIKYEARLDLIRA